MNTIKIEFQQSLSAIFRNWSRFRGHFVLTIGAILILTAVSFVVYFHAKSIMEKNLLSEHDTIIWSFSQSEVSLARFEVYMERFFRGEETIENVQKKFKIFESRMLYFKEGLVSKSLYELPNFDAKLAAFWQRKSAISQGLMGGAEKVRVDAEAFRRALAILKSELRDISNLAVAKISNDNATEQQTTYSLILLLGFLALALLFSFFVALARTILSESHAQVSAEQKTESLARAEAYLANAFDAIVVIDRHGVIVQANAAARNIFGICSLAKEFRPVTDYLEPDPESASSPIPFPPDTWKIGGDFPGFGRKRMFVRNTLGPRIPVDVATAYAPIQSVDYFILNIRDLTDQISFEKELIMARDKAEQSEAAQAQLLSVVSHELRTPVNGILAASELLLTTNDPAESRRLVETLDVSGNTLLQVINDVLQSSEPVQSNDRWEREKINLNDVFIEVTRNQETLADAKDITLCFAPDDAEMSPWVYGSASKIKRILFNLVGNAIKATSLGSVEIGYKRGTAGFFEIFVNDTGPGLIQEAMDVLEMPVATSHLQETQNEVRKGLGLGIVRMIAESMGGRITATSRAGKGTKFNLVLPYLPVEKDEVTPVPVPVPGTVAPPNLKLRPLRILLAEDHDLNRVLICRILERSGHQVKTVEDGVLAVQAALAETFDVIVMDIAMPRLAGPDAVKAIRSSATPSAQTPILGLTAFAMEHEVQSFLRIGMNRILTKPAKGPELNQALLELVGEATPVAASKAPAPERDLIDQNVVADLVEMIDTTRLSEILLRFETDFLAAIAQLKRLFKEKSVDFQPSLHQFCGLARVMGAETLGEELQGLLVKNERAEVPISLGDLDRLSPLLTATMAQLNETIQSLTAANRSGLIHLI